MPMSSQQSELDESLETVEPVPIKVERQEPEVDIATTSAPKAPEPKPEPASKPEPPPAVEATPPRQEESLERDIEPEPVTGQEPEEPEVQPDPEPGDEAPFEYDQAGFAILDESLQLAGSTAGCGSDQAGCRQVDGNSRQVAGDLETLFDSKGYDFNELQVADDTGLKAYELTSRNNPDIQQYLHVWSGGLGVTFYVVAPELLTLEELNEKLNAV
ncbi:MAG: hypothetical protein HC812_01210 [Leptolyngbya sp. RL_3_1]|nr:hypothetical protein [Leptolyngbya sp. RL_3_1]